MKYWLMKSEPFVYSIDDLARDRTTSWDGVRNYQARNFIRDDMQIGDLAIFYHSNSEPPAAVGVCEISSEAMIDETQFDHGSENFDPRSKPENPAWIAREVTFIKKFKKPVSIDEMRSNKKLSEMLILRKGNRLSVTPITKQEFDEIEKMGG